MFFFVSFKMIWLVEVQYLFSKSISKLFPWNIPQFITLTLNPFLEYLLADALDSIQ